MTEDHDKRIDHLAEVLRAINEQGDTFPEDEFEWIGPYKLLEPIGEGGMGVVHLAEQKEPVKRKVALKIIRAGLVSREMIARFETERQALAMMSHPNIARVLDAGESEQGDLYFVMEHVAGVSITKYCDTQKLTTKERLHLFMQVCEAVQHSHQKGVIHRDIKPSNILVTAHQGDKPLVKMIDFGISKATGNKLTDKTLFTAQGQMIGTPEYMSPEQTDMVGVDVDTRTDIYSLGVLLYELLVGQLPLNLREIPFLEVVQKIREEEPQKPSTKITTTGDAAAEIARLRRTQPWTLAREIRGDLDWVTLKAMEKDRTRRYSSVTDFAADVQCHLNFDPVSARPPSASYRMKKFVQKNARFVASVAAVFLAAVIGMVTSLVFYVRSETAREKAEYERGQATKAKTQAEENEQEARRNLDNFLRLSDVKRLEQLRSRADDLWPACPEMTVPMAEWLRDARALVTNLEAHHSSLQELRMKAVLVPSLSKNAGEDGRLRTSGPTTEAGSDSEDRWIFADTKSQWLHDVLAELVRDLQEFDDAEGSIAEVAQRFEFARLVHERTVEDYDVEWEDAIVSIANTVECPAYRGLRIEPQVGLIPIGQDPVSGLWEFAHLQTGDIPVRDETDAIVITPEMGLVFVLIPGGKFSMGAQRENERMPNYDPQANADEKPVHDVTLKEFFLSKYEMTQAQWVRFVGNNPSLVGAHNYQRNWDRSSARRRKRLFGLHPVEEVSWDDCTEVMRRLGLAIPTEAQWEYAARAGTSTVYSTGNEVILLQGSANLADSYAKANGAKDSWRCEMQLDDGYTAHAPIGPLCQPE